MALYVEALQSRKFTIHKIIHMDLGKESTKKGDFSVFFQELGDLSTVSTEKTVHNVDKCKIYASRDIGIFLTIVDKSEQEKRALFAMYFNLILM